MKCYICGKSYEHIIEVLSPHKTKNYYFCISCWDSFIRLSYHNNITSAKEHFLWLAAETALLAIWRNPEESKKVAEYYLRKSGMINKKGEVLR